MSSTDAPGRSQRPKAPGDQFAHLSSKQRASIKELAEVERAIAILEGRSDANPEDIAFARTEAERLRNNLSAALERTEENIREVRRAQILRAAAMVAALGALAVAGVLAVPRAMAWFGARGRASAAAERAASPFTQEGFSAVTATIDLAPQTVTGQRGRCYVAVAGAANGPARVRVDRDPVSAEGASVGYCTCGPEPVRITPSGSEPVELRVLAATASLTGGADLLGVLRVPPEARIPEVADRACAEEAIDAFIVAHPAAVPAGTPELPEAARLTSLGLRRIAFAPPSLPMVVLPEAKETCFLVLSDDRTDALSLRLQGGERPLTAQRAPIAICGRDLASVSVWHEGPPNAESGSALTKGGALHVFSISSSRVGGLLGMLELSQRIGRPAALWAPRPDLPFDAAAALFASGLAPLRPDDPPVPPAPNAGAPAWLVALSTDDRSMLDVPEATPDALCRPPVHVGITRALCLETRADALGPQTLPDGLARARRPLWLPVARGDRAQNERVLDLLALSRRLSAAGFDITTLTGFTEIPGGVEVTGRSGEDKIVAVSVSVSPPYLHVLTDGPTWTLADEPRIVPLTAGKSVKLKAVPPFLGPRSGRETIVWRR